MGEDGHSRGDEQADGHLTVGTGDGSMFGTLIGVCRLSRNGGRRSALRIHVLRRVLVLVLTVRILAVLPVRILVRIVLVLPIRLAVESIGVVALGLLTECHNRSLTRLRITVRYFSDYFMRAHVLRCRAETTGTVYPMRNQTVNLCTTFVLSFRSNKSVTSTVTSESSFKVYPIVTVPVAPGWTSAKSELESYPAGFSL